MTQCILTARCLVVVEKLTDTAGENINDTHHRNKFCILKKIVILCDIFIDTFPFVLEMYKCVYTK